MVTEEDRERNREWARRKAAEAPPLTPEEIAAIKAALSEEITEARPPLTDSGGKE